MAVDQLLTVAIAVVVGLGGGAGISQIIRAKSGKKVDEASAASTNADAEATTVDTVVKVMKELEADWAKGRDEIHTLRNRVTGQEGRILDLEQRLQKETQKRITLTERIVTLSTKIDELRATAALTDTGLHKSLDDLHAAIAAVKQEVTTGNAQSIAQLADQAETRRAEAIPPDDRSAAEQGHLDAMGEDDG